ncbi:porin [Micromonospora sp. NPDC005806]|uniref:LppU/SCO3897 family protein n=1 Tax=Micromonospora sp. NPDC005806 TaxID=3364234 RepID=UPI0036A2AB73
MSEQATLAPVRPETVEAPPPGPFAEPVLVPVPEPAEPSRAGAVLGVAVLLLGIATALLTGLLIKVGTGGSLREVFIGVDGTAEAKVGDCVAELPPVAGTEARSADDARVVPCTATDAAYAVVGRVQDATAARERSADACEPHFRPDDDGYVLYRVGEDGDGYLLCLVHRANRR